ncbi:MAG: hypothetical protein HDR21_13985 [Lachnospiraceae bacterium]|nr:hypothetical protein [Lachnospiraceae bacterium]
MTENNTEKTETEKVENGSRIVMIRTELLMHHPENPRKTIGDITELAESMKKNGVMQNLTVIPAVPKEKDYNPQVPVDEFEKDPNNAHHRYHVLIGNRRMEAAKTAGVELVPCRIVTNMPLRQQLGIMLEENMQRSDLTIYEQAQGFQMMLDLGETEDTIAAKTGFGKTTIRHRLNIAKLDQRTLKVREADTGFQLQIKDLIELEKVKSIKTRNKILKEATNSKDLVRRALQEAQQEKRMEHAKAIKVLLDKRGIKEEPSAHNNLYGGTWEIVKEIDLDEEPPKKLRIGDDGELFWANNWRGLAIIKKKTGKKERTLSEWEIEQKERDKLKKQVKSIVNVMVKDITAFIKDIIDGKVEPVKQDEVLPLLWKAMLASEPYVSTDALLSYVVGKDKWNITQKEKETALPLIEGMDVVQQMLILLPNAVKGTDLTDWSGYYNPEAGAKLAAVHDALALYGFDWTDSEHAKITDGTNELYKSKGKK